MCLCFIEVMRKSCEHALDFDNRNHYLVSHMLSVQTAQAYKHA